MKNLLRNKKISKIALSSIILSSTLMPQVQVFANHKSPEIFSIVDQSQYLTISKVFPDKNVAKVIADQLNKEINDNTTLEELEGITNVNIDNKGVKSIEGIQYLKNLKYLFGINNKIKDISPLSDLEHLHKLMLQENEISDLSPLEGKVSNSLSRIWLSNNKVKDVSPLSKLTHMVSISIDRNEISDLSPLENYMWLLDVSDQRIYLDKGIVGKPTKITLLGQVGEEIKMDSTNEFTYIDGNLIWNEKGSNVLEFRSVYGPFFSGTIFQNTIDKWKSGTQTEPTHYVKGDTVEHNGKEYTVAISHDNYGDLNWAPHIANNLFNEV